MSEKPDWMTPPEGGWRRVGEPQVRLDNPWIRVTDEQAIAPTGRPARYGVVHFKNLAMAVLPLHEDGSVTLVGQHRYVSGDYSWELPEGGGALDIEPLDSAKRELAEETGLMAAEWRKVLDVELSNSITDERGVGFIATGLTQGSTALDETEDLRLARVPFAELLDQVIAGNITDVLTVAMTLRAYHMAKTDGFSPELTRAMLG